MKENFDSPHGGNRLKSSMRFAVPEESLIDFSSNINPLGLHPSVEHIIQENINELLFYPDPDCLRLKSALADHYHLTPDHILPGNGSAELIYLLVQVIQPKNVLLTEPNFTEYAMALSHSDCNITRIVGKEKKSFKVPVLDICKKVPGHRMLFLSNPNNPVGYMYSREELLKLLKTCETHQCYLLVDEVFVHFTQQYNTASLVDLVPQYNYLMVLQAFTKIFAIPGLRLGMLLAEKDLTQTLSTRQVPWSINCLAQRVGASVIRETQFIADTANFVTQQRALMIESLSKLKNLTVFPSQVNYVLCKINGPQNLEELEIFLGSRGFMIRNCSNYIGLDERFFRIAVRTEDENRRLLKLLTEFF
jgi:threonine-phosphate decarboxylase